MRSADEIRQHILDELASAVRRMGMYAVGAMGAEDYLWRRLHDLAYIDGRETDLRAQLDLAQSRRISNHARVLGALRYRLARQGEKFDMFRFSDEVTSVYAEIASRLGYLDVERRLTPAERQRMLKEVTSKCRERDWRSQDVVAAFGPPSLKCGGTWSHVLCYAPCRPDSAWICFDFHIAHEVFRESFQGDPANDPDGRWHRHVGVGNPPLRNVRWQTSRGFRCLFTPYGRCVLSWKDGAAAAIHAEGAKD